MVADKVEVLTKSAKAGSAGLRWVSDGTGTFEIEDTDNIDVGTTIVLHLKSDCREYADEERIKSKFTGVFEWGAKYKLKKTMFSHFSCYQKVQQLRRSSRLSEQRASE